MDPAIIRIICAALGRIIELVAAAFEGDMDSARRVSDILPTPLRAELLLASERARLDKLKG